MDALTAVFVVVYHDPWDHNGASVTGVFSTRENANAGLAAAATRILSLSPPVSDFEVQEFVLDE